MSIKFIISANTDIGTTKRVNQDSLSVKVLNTSQGKMAFALLCDGMGGLSCGEVASASVVQAFDKWIKEEFPLLCGRPLEDGVIRAQWETLLEEQNARIKAYGEKHDMHLGTTVVAMLLTQTRHYIVNVGDSRAYVIADSLIQITHDHTLVAREVEQGLMTEQQAEKSGHRNVLTQCLGVKDRLQPEYFFGEVKKNAVYMLCSDGFRHEVTREELFARLQPPVLLCKENMTDNATYLIKVNKQRGETDNISVVLVRTY